MKIVMDFWKRHKKILVILLFLTVISAASEIAFPYVLKIVIDGIKENFSREVLINYSILLLILGLIRSVLQVILPVIREIYNEKFSWLVRSEIFSRILIKGHSFTEKFPTGDIIERLSEDLNELSWFAGSGIFRPVQAVFILTFTIIILLSINPLLTVVCVSPVLLVIIIWIKLGNRIYGFFKEWREKMSETNNFFESSFSGIKLIKSYLMEERNKKTLHKILDERFKVGFKVTKIESKIGVFYSSIAEIGTILVLLVGGMLVTKEKLTIGEFVAFNAYVSMLMNPIMDIATFFVIYKKARASTERISALAEHQSDVKNIYGKNKVAEFKNIKLKEVYFKYNGENVLKNINIEIYKGKRIGIAGMVGAGKSTIFRLLLHLAEPEKGVITINELAIEEYEIESLRNIFGYVPQEPTLFSDSVLNNIVFGRKYDSNEMKKLIEIALLENDIKKFPNGINELIGERGIRLSGGQKERVAIARALFGKPKILILDDATSNLDSETEKELIKRTMEYMKDSTLIIVSHRLSILSSCDMIYVMNKGEITEKGTHEELLNKHNLYWTLYEKQLIEEIAK